MKQDHKICRRCGEDKPLDQFKARYKNMKQGLTQYYEGQCLACGNNYDKEFMRDKRSHVSYRKAEYKRQKDKYQADPRIGMFDRAKKRARKIGCDFSITLNDIVLPDTCPLLDIALMVNEGGIADNSYSLDKIDPKKGYTKDNIMVMSNLANAMKNRANVEELRMFCTNMLRIINDPKQ